MGINDNNSIDGRELKRMVSEKGILPLGIERDGKFHREFEIRPALVRDSVELSAEQDPKRLENERFSEACKVAKQLLCVGDIKPVTLEILEDMFLVDLEEIKAAQGRLAARLQSFHAQEEQPNG